MNIYIIILAVIAILSFAGLVYFALKGAQAKADGKLNLAELEKTHLRQEIERLEGENKNTRYTHNTTAFIEDIAAASMRSIFEMEDISIRAKSYIEKINDMARAARPGPYAYDPDRPSGNGKGKKA